MTPAGNNTGLARMRFGRKRRTDGKKQPLQTDQWTDGRTDVTRVLKKPGKLLEGAESTPGGRAGMGRLHEPKTRARPAGFEIK